MKPVNRKITRDCYRFELTGLDKESDFVRHRLLFFKGKALTFCLHIREPTLEKSPEIKAIIDSVRIN